MQYHIQTLVKHLFDKDSFEQVTVQELKQFTDDYPYAAVAQFLYARKLKDAGSYNHYQQSEQASLHFHNALWFRWQLEHKEEAPALPAHAEGQAQQPGFRIVVQMPKQATPAGDAPPAIKEEEKPEQAQPPVQEQPAVQQPEATIPVEQEKVAEVEAIAPTPLPEVQATVAAILTAPPELEVWGQPETVDTPTEAEQTAAPVPDREPSPALEQTEQPIQENIVTEIPAAGSLPAEPVLSVGEPVTSAVALAESSQLAEENQAETAVNAVSITDVALAAVAAMPSETTVADNTVTPSEPVAENETVPATEATVENTIQSVEASPVEAITPPEPIISTEEPKAEEAAAETAPIPPAAAQPVEAAPTDAPVSTIPGADTEQSAAATAVNGTPGTATAPTQVPQPEPVATPVIFTQANQEAKPTVDLGEPIFESYHTIDYFASQGIKLRQEDFKDQLGKQLKSFTDWLRSMKRIGPMEINTSLDEVTSQSIQRIAEHSVEEKEVLTEAMAEVWVKQGHAKKAIQVYEKLSLLNPAKSHYFAGRIEQLKAL